MSKQIVSLSRERRHAATVFAVAVALMMLGFWLAVR